MTYKDITFCTFWEECKNASTCKRALTPKVQAGAEKWWGNKDYPIATFLDKPECFEQIENDTRRIQRETL